MEQMVNVKRICEVLGVKAHWLYRETKKRKIPHYRVGGHLRFSLTEINQYLKENHRAVQV